MTDSVTFDGFVVPEKNWFPMPNEWVDICAGIDNLSELKVVQYVLRHTWGYHEYGITKAISVEEFMYGRKRSDGSRIDKGTGLKSDRSVKDGIKLALKHGYIVCEVDNTDKARIKKSYALKMFSEGYNLPPDARGVQSTPQNGQVDTTPLTGDIYPSSGYNLPLGGSNSTPRSEKDTIERHYRKTLEERQEFGAFAPSPSDVALSSTENFTLEEMGETYGKALEFLKPHGQLEEVKSALPPAEIILLAQKLYNEGFRADGTFVDTPTAENAQEQASEPPTQEVPQPELPVKNHSPEPPQQQTLMAPVQQQSARVDTGKHPSSKRQKAVPQLTLAGQHIIDLYDASKPVKRKTMLNHENVSRANGIGEMAESDDDFNEVVRLMRADDFLKQNNVAIDLDFICRKWDRYIAKVDQLREAAAQAEKARREAEERAKTQAPPRTIKLTPLQQQLRDIEVKYAPKSPQGGH